MAAVSASYGAIGSQLLDYPCPHTGFRRYSSARLTGRRAISLVEFFLRGVEILLWRQLEEPNVLEIFRRVGPKSWAMG